MSKAKYSLKEIRDKSYKKRDPIWANIFWNPFAAPVLWIIANFTSLTPNAITTISLILGLITGVFFLTGHFIIGAIIFQVAYFFDALDGKLARLLGKSSLAGEMYDNITDRVKIVVWSATLLLGVYWYYPQYYSLIIVFVIFIYAYLSLSISNLWLFYEKFKINLGIKEKNETIKANNLFLKVCERLKIIPSWTDIESACLLFTVLPILIGLNLLNEYQTNMLLIIFIILQTMLFLVLSIYVYKKIRGQNEED